ncbi:YjdF family protein [Oscillospiraceae bacterium OttesenSCG-928-G22]|nr:YjdF family protein [Oscillospiraceae bacterium OttesenSCG-928-G22]
MISVTARLHILFDDPFWVGIFERDENGRRSVSRVVFGAEPKDGEVYSYFLTHWHALQFSPPVRVKEVGETRQNPKRVQRSISKALRARGISTKSQEALSLQREAHKLSKQQNAKAAREAESNRRFEERQRKKKEKHKGH